MTMTPACACPTCQAYTVSLPDGHGDYCPSCLTVVTRLHSVKIVKPYALRASNLVR
jgi:hypothetical protein